MAFGFIPLFFSGFLFTAGPKWLGVEPLPVEAISRTAGGAGGGVAVLWLAGAHLWVGVALVGLAVATAGLVWMTAQFWGRVRRSQAEDQLHARTIAWACTLGCISLVGAVAGAGCGHPCARTCLGLHRPVGVCSGGVCHGGAPHDSIFHLQCQCPWCRPGGLSGCCG